ncbi:MAG: phosphatase PAP2 family protein [Acidimicrobiales bacterium]
MASWKPPERWVPPAVPLPSQMAGWDRTVDSWFESHLRGRTAVDRVMYGATALGDHGIIWMLLAGAQALRWRHGNWQRRFLRATVGLAVESAVVNGPVKWAFRRTRPIHDGPRPLHLRQPRTSSFPSGHATAAFFGAALLRDGDPWWPLYYAIAVVVASSRVHVRIHHASDVVGGALLGVALGELARKLVPAEPEEAEESRSACRGWT